MLHQQLFKTAAAHSTHSGCRGHQARGHMEVHDEGHRRTRQARMDVYNVCSVVDYPAGYYLLHITIVQDQTVGPLGGWWAHPPSPCVVPGISLDGPLSVRSTAVRSRTWLLAFSACAGTGQSDPRLFWDFGRGGVRGGAPDLMGVTRVSCQLHSRCDKGLVYMQQNITYSILKWSRVMDSLSRLYKTTVETARHRIAKAILVRFTRTPGWQSLLPCACDIISSGEAGLHLLLLVGAVGHNRAWGVHCESGPWG